MIYPIFQDLPLIPSRSAMNELYQNELDIHDALEVLESGYNCPKSKRSKGTIEKCLDIKRKTIRIVVVKSFDYHSDTEEVRK